DGGGEDLGVVAPADAGGEAGLGGVGALERGRAEGDDRHAVLDDGGGRAAVAADDRDLLPAHAGDLDDLGRRGDADEVSGAEGPGVVDGEEGGGAVVGEGGLVDARGVGDERVLDPLVHGAAGLAARIAEVVEQGRLVRADDADDVGDVL